MTDKKDSGEKKTVYVSVKIDAEVYRLLRTVAAWEGEYVADYLSRLVRPLAERAYNRMPKDASTTRREE